MTSTPEFVARYRPTCHQGTSTFGERGAGSSAPQLGHDDLAELDRYCRRAAPPPSSPPNASGSTASSERSIAYADHVVDQKTNQLVAGSVIGGAPRGKGGFLCALREV